MSAFAGLAAARADAAEAARLAGYRSEGFVPEQMNPPLVVIAPAQPFITGSGSFDPTEFACHFDVFLIVGNAVNKTMVTKLDSMIQDVIRFLGEWNIGQVNEPFVGVANSKKYLMTRISINALFTLSEPEE